MPRKAKRGGRTTATARDDDGRAEERRRQVEVYKNDFETQCQAYRQNISTGLEAQIQSMRGDFRVALVSIPRHVREANWLEFILAPDGDTTNVEDTTAPATGDDEQQENNEEMELSEPVVLVEEDENQEQAEHDRRQEGAQTDQTVQAQSSSTMSAIDVSVFSLPPSPEVQSRDMPPPPLIPKRPTTTRNNTNKTLHASTKTPAVKPNPFGRQQPSIITPKVNVGRTPLTLRVPRAGEICYSVKGSPVTTALAKKRMGIGKNPIAGEASTSAAIVLQNQNNFLTIDASADSNRESLDKTLDESELGLLTALRNKINKIVTRNEAKQKNKQQKKGE